MSNWRTGRKVPLNVYEGDRPVCQCHNEEDAARIAAGMNLAGIAAMNLERASKGFAVPPVPASPDASWESDRAAPVYANEARHRFTPVIGNPFCGRCGAGRLHEIHQER